VREAIGRPRQLTRRRLLILAGKGGVGRSTVAAAMAVVAARSGARVIVAETAGRADVPPMLGRRAGEPLVETELLPDLHHVTIDRHGALEEYLRLEAPGPVPAAVLARSRAFQLFVDAAPGMSDLLTIGKVWELAQHPRHKRHAQAYDLVILDAPASGQVVGLLAAPRTFSEIARVGPVARQASHIAHALSDRSSVGVIALATPEQMAVTEAVALRRALSDEFGIDLDGVLVNRVFPTRFTAEDERALAAAPDDPAVRSARWFYGRGRAQHAQLQRLRNEFQGLSCTTLPFVFKAALDTADIERLADLLTGVGG
jgi:anion-transporting  ArsA/GET3 family ATPase